MLDFFLIFWISEGYILYISLLRLPLAGTMHYEPPPLVNCADTGVCYRFFKYNYLTSTVLLFKPIQRCFLSHPVSYTHLDVYKRQVQDTWDCRGSDVSTDHLLLVSKLFIWVRWKKRSTKKKDCKDNEKFKWELLQDYSIKDLY